MSWAISAHLSDILNLCLKHDYNYTENLPGPSATLVLLTFFSAVMFPSKTFESHLPNKLKISSVEVNVNPVMKEQTQQSRVKRTQTPIFSFLISWICVMISPADSFEHISLHVNVFLLALHELATFNPSIMTANRPYYFMPIDQPNEQFSGSLHVVLSYSPKTFF